MKINTHFARALRSSGEKPQNNFPMKFPLVTSIALLAALPAVSRAEDKPLKERAEKAFETIKQETREATAAATKAARKAWNATQEYLTEDPREYRDGATRKLEELSGDVIVLKENLGNGPVASRNYFATRVAALAEHLEFARAELAKLPKGKEAGYDEARRQLNNTVEHLEKAVSQAQTEAADAT